MTSEAPNVQKDGPRWLSMALDFGPLLLFFLTNHLARSDSDPARGPIMATGVFMVAIVIAMIIARWKLGKISPMMWVSGVLVVGFGGITILLGEPKYIQIKPTVVYLLFAAVLFAGLLRGKSLLKYLLEFAFEGVSDIGWKKLSRNWALFFIFMAGANEVLRYYFDFSTWLGIRTFTVIPVTLLFTFTQIPLLMRHGLKLGDEDEKKGD